LRHSLGDACPGDIIVNANGKIIPSSRTKTIASVDVASVVAIHVVEGQAVKSGDLLVELDAGTFQAEKRGPIYRATVSLDRPTILIEGRPVPLTPGMAVQVEIQTGTRRVIEYILSPLLRHRHESLNER
jgi:hemolysin D